MSRQEAETNSISCPVCGSRGPQTTATHGEYTIRHCPSCDLDFTDPMKAEAEVYEHLSGYVYRDALLIDPLKSDYKWDILQFLKSPPHSKGRLLDVGCGTGFFVRRAIDMGFDAYGIDFSERSVEAGREYFGLKNIYASNLSGFLSKFKELRFDIVTLFHVLEHLEDPNSLLRQIKSCLTDIGVVVIAVPYRDRWPDFLSDYDLPPHHLTRWSPKAIRNILERNSFHVSKLKIENFPPRRTAEFLYQHVMKIAPFLTLKGKGIDLTSRKLSPEDSSRLTDFLGSIDHNEVERMLKKSMFRKSIANILGFPIWMALKLLGAKGPFLYVEATLQKN